ncbi:MAG TPA: hypothetical protein HA282_00825 [Nanoarchaeota archaeon]|nr:hypothetical protein [Candidatus Pacearchaeota archaeon]HIH18268.1 hypothetical protein [Nanoarchaeota archaeon]HIH34138.1 hypothetical protein [Nanoarchaeota archaeon]HIH51552.1 hypothetical protein [Nanoarchaeota archaeon]HIH65745.1 hypothetical protein [Nanoarchaeota archaeon]
MGLIQRFKDRRRVKDLVSEYERVFGTSKSFIGEVISGDKGNLSSNQKGYMHLRSSYSTYTFRDDGIGFSSQSLEYGRRKEAATLKNIESYLEWFVKNEGDFDDTVLDATDFLALCALFDEVDKKFALSCFFHPFPVEEMEKGVMNRTLPEVVNTLSYQSDGKLDPFELEERIQKRYAEHRNLNKAYRATHVVEA